MLLGNRFELGEQLPNQGTAPLFFCRSLNIYALRNYGTHLGRHRQRHKWETMLVAWGRRYVATLGALVADIGHVGRL